jgi:hypothetical protein
MTTDLSHAAERDLNAVTDVSGVDPSLRQKVSASGADAEAATAALREAIRELHRSDDEAWRRYAVDLEEATRRFDTTVGIAAARLRAERAASKEDLGSVVDDVMETWRARADELRVRAHVGQMDVRDLVSDTAAELDLASQRLGAVVVRLRSEVGESLTLLRHEVTTALDDAGRILRGLPH